jgi:hypothetical protein
VEAKANSAEHRKGQLFHRNVKFELSCKPIFVKTTQHLKQSSLITPMVWKILSALSAVCLGVAAYFANASKNDIPNELALEKRAKENLAEAKGKRLKGGEVHETKKKRLVAINEDLSKVKLEVTTAEADVKQKEAELELAKKNLEQIAQQLAAVQAKIKEAGDIEKLLAQVDSLKKEKETAELEVTNQTQALAAATEKISSIQAETEKYRQLDARQRRGEIEPDFEGRIAQYFGEWGFAVLDKGNAAGVVANADLDVKRGQDIVAKLKVKNVENKISVVDVVPGSMAEGDSLRTGDLVVAAPKKAAPAKVEAPTEKPTEGATPPATPAAPAPGADPFGGGMAPAAAPAPAPGTDPFGAAPAPAPAPAPGADPFGGGMAPAPAAPAPAPGADPFGGAPTTPPAAGAGTKESPSTADPFK